MEIVLLQIGQNEDKPYIFGGKLPGVFEFESFHFHWGSSSDRGSEHNIDYERYSMEMHLVHRNQKYQTLVEARDHPDGIAVIAVFLDVSMTLLNQNYTHKNCCHIFHLSVTVNSIF